MKSPPSAYPRTFCPKAKVQSSFAFPCLEALLFSPNYGSFRFFTPRFVAGNPSAFGRSFKDSTLLGFFPFPSEQFDFSVLEIRTSWLKIFYRKSSCLRRQLFSCFS